MTPVRPTTEDLIAQARRYADSWRDGAGRGGGPDLFRALADRLAEQQEEVLERLDKSDDADLVIEWERHAEWWVAHTNWARGHGDTPLAAIAAPAEAIGEGA